MGLTVSPDASLASLNTFGVPARARLLLALDDADDVDAARSALAGSPPPLILGGGSNLLLTHDVEGAVLHLRSRGMEAHPTGSDTVQVRAAAGERWHDLVRWTLQAGLWGLENLSLIPGSVGAAPIQNIGAYGVELRERFDRLQAVHLVTGERRVFDAAACAFGYRHSVFKTPGQAGWLITEVWLRLSRRPTVSLGYAELRDELARRGESAPTPEQVARAVCDIRRRKLPDPAVLGNAGSFFKNPLVSPSRAAELRRLAPRMPQYASGDPADTRVKLSAGWLIDQCGWKGHRDGDAGVHAQHALVLVNHGRATGAQLLGLARRIVESVQDRFEVTLEPEPVIL